MEFRAQAAIAAQLIFAAAAFGQTEHRFAARHDHARQFCAGTLVFRADGVAFEEGARRKARKKPHAWAWKYADIQQLLISPAQVRIVTYDDVRWKLGLDRELQFDLTRDAAVQPVYETLRGKLDQRFVAALADEPVRPLWRMPVKGGTLIAGEDRIVLAVERKGGSRTWRYQDIDNISTEGPFQLTLTVFERSLVFYGGRKHFHLQLKEALPEERFDALWRRLDAARGISVLSNYSRKEH